MFLIVVMTKQHFVEKGIETKKFRVTICKEVPKSNAHRETEKFTVFDLI